MRLLVDVGNTAVKLGLDNDGDIALVNEADIPWREVSDIVVAQVGHANALESITHHAACHSISIRQATVTPTLGTVRCGYGQYQNLGIDRWLAVVASHYLYPHKHCVVVDSGTATKVDVVDISGQHLGGWILPGLDMMIASLLANTEKVFSDNTSLFAQELGCNTPNAVKNGALVSTLGAVYTAIAQLECDAKDMQVIFAGGYGELLQQHYEKPSIFIDDLVFKGLKNWCDFVR
ncbi:type III pantothenate kinase [Pseudoalteromonas citrea]|uniref:Type III pantothenate kinase n=2 Tax=Pseudoalteromonas citrea TaxID=43655 RepID=A0AAD4FQU5_9GAMM|nr:type III pantothenate kinase [Pseudoalteromonas citrea]KAF7767659.1 type III pantothenate kinase [Pseudoalteromonas citrea]